MITIYKYQLARNQSVYEMPMNAKILHVAMQHDIPCVWALVDTDNVTVRRAIVTVGTGDHLDTMFDQEHHIGTVITSSNMFVWHVFDFGEQ